MSIMVGWCWSRPRLVSSLHMTPEDMMASRVDRLPPAGVVVERGQDRLGEGVAHDGDEVHVLAVDGVEQLDRVEVGGR